MPATRDYALGERVIVDGDRGPRLAWIAAPPARGAPTRDRGLRRVIRRANEHDLRGERDGEARPRAARCALAKDKAAALRLPLKVFRVEVIGQLGRGARLNVYYTSDERLDLRDFVRDLGSATRLRASSCASSACATRPRRSAASARAGSRCAARRGCPTSCRSRSRWPRIRASCCRRRRCRASAAGSSAAWSTSRPATPSCARACPKLGKRVIARARRGPRRRGRRAAPARPRVVRRRRHRGLAGEPRSSRCSRPATSQREHDHDDHEPETTTTHDAGPARSHDLLHHDADLLRQRRPAPRPRVHDDRRRRARAVSPDARRRHAVSDRHRRARPEGRGGREQARADAAAARRSGRAALRRDVEGARHRGLSLHPHDRATSHKQVVARAVEADPRAQPRRPLPRVVPGLVLRRLRGVLHREPARQGRRHLGLHRRTRSRSTGSTRSAAGSSGCRSTPSRCSTHIEANPDFIRPERTATRSSRS